MDPEYRKKRDRNNQAVKKSRVKSKQKTDETNDRVRQLKVDNEKLEDRLKTTNKHLQFLKSLFLEQAQAKASKLTEEEIRRCFADENDDASVPDDIANAHRS